MYDIILIHPPAIYDFRKRIVFPGPIAYTVRESTNQFIIPPIGMFSIAEYLQRNGFKVIIDNIADRMVYDSSFDVEKHLKSREAKIYAIGLHWAIHSQGAIEIAKLCKKLHPNSIVILGGLTATIFHLEILKNFNFIDAIIRGEAEISLLELINKMEKSQELPLIPNVTVRSKEGRILIGNTKKVNIDINRLEFTRLDLIEPKRAFFTKDIPPHFSIPISRGCIYNCASCGGSSYSYKTYLHRDKPSFRNPDKIVEDLEKLYEQGVKMVFLFQDPRMGGRRYYESLIRKLRTSHIPLTHVSMELFKPANEEYVRNLSKINIPLTLTISPESGADNVRIAHGRNYTNEQLLKTIKICQKYRDNIHLIVFFMLGLANETLETINQTVKLWEKICIMDRGLNSVSFAFGPMILLDPGSLAFDYPARFGYKLVFKNFRDYIEGLSMPSWHQWISYETKFLTRDDIANLSVRLIEQSISLREKYGIYDRTYASRERIYYVFINKLVIKEVNEAMKIKNNRERQLKLKALKESINRYLEQLDMSWIY